MMKHNLIRKTGLVIALALLATLMVACNKKQTNKPQYLAVMSAASGVISDAKNGYTLTLDNVNPKTLWFTDRPVRKAGFMKTKTFLASWQQYYKNDNPNVGLVHTKLSADVSGQIQPMAFELSQPVMHDASLTFKLSSLTGDRVIPGRLKHVTLFIDDFPRML